MLIRRNLSTIKSFMKRSRSGNLVKDGIHSMRELSQVVLEPAEEKLTNLLQEAASKGVFSNSDVQIRYAGGWVRDKLLSKKSHDIDIAISSLSGHDFAVQFSEFLKRDHPELKTGTITKIHANPEKSKHLDTATSKFLNLELDFVQLRTEAYGSANTRTPTIVDVGTLEQDAERRDCTMNALYFNVHSRSIEDPTEKGLRDLSQGCIQTPLAPRKTFLDDPLRVLRCIRFSSQFGFEIEEKTLAEMKTMDVRQALKDKVVKERVGIEILKMMKGSDPPKAIEALYMQDLYPVVFEDREPQEEGYEVDFSFISKAVRFIESSQALQTYLKEYEDGRLWLMISMLPYHPYTRPLRRKADLQEPFACIIVRECLKLSNTHEQLAKAVYPPREVDITAQSSVLELGKFVRSIGKDWPLAVFISYITTSDSNAELEPMLKLFDCIHAAGLESAWKLKPFLDGKKIKPLLQEAGADITLMKNLVELVVEFRIEDPTINEEQTLSKLRGLLQSGALQRH